MKKVTKLMLPVFALIMAVLCEYDEAERVSEMGSALADLFNKMAGQAKNQNPNPVRAVFREIRPKSVRPNKGFTLRVVVEYCTLSDREFYFKVDEGDALPGYLDSDGLACADVTGLALGSHAIFISYDKINWTPVGTLKAAKRSIFFWITISLLVVAGLYGYSYMRVYLKRQIRKRRSGSGIRHLPR